MALKSQIVDYFSSPFTLMIMITIIIIIIIKARVGGQILPVSGSFLSNVRDCFGTLYSLLWRNWNNFYRKNEPHFLVIFLEKSVKIISFPEKWFSITRETFLITSHLSLYGQIQILSQFQYKFKTNPGDVNIVQKISISTFTLLSNRDWARRR